MTDWKRTKRGLIKAGYVIERSSGHGAILLRKENNVVLMWIDKNDTDTYWYLFFVDGHNTSFHRKGFAVWEECGREYNYLNCYHDMAENVLEYGKHFGHHVDLNKIIDLVFTTKEESA